MKFTIHGFSQEAALNLDLDNDDLLLLRWFVDFKDSGRMIHKIIDDKNYYWVNYKKVVEALPLLCLKKDSIYRKFKKMADCGVLTRITVRIAGTFSFYAIGKNYELLIFNGNYNQPKSKGQIIPLTKAEPEHHHNFVEQNFIANDSNNTNTTYHNFIEQNYNANNNNNTHTNYHNFVEQNCNANNNSSSHTVHHNFVEQSFSSTNKDYSSQEIFDKNSSSPNYANFESRNFPEPYVKISTNSEIFPTDFDETPDQKISPSNYSKKINKNLVDTSVEYQLGAFFFAKIQELNPKFKTPNLVKWSKEFYKLLKIDNRSLKEIQQLIDWIFTPGNFWSCQILSPAKLRSKFDELVIRMDFDEKRFCKNSHTRFKAGSTKYDLAGFEVINDF